jgi:HSP20 family protein
MLNRLDPFAPFFFLERFDNGLPRARRNGDAASWEPAADVTEDKDVVRVALDLPGVAESAIDVKLEDGLLVVSGERRRETAEGVEALRSERRAGTFRRTFKLGPTIDATAIKAELKAGVLTLTLPKRAESVARTIKVVAHN